MMFHVPVEQVFIQQEQQQTTATTTAWWDCLKVMLPKMPCLAIEHINIFLTLSLPRVPHKTHS